VADTSNIRDKAKDTAAAAGHAAGEAKGLAKETASALTHKAGEMASNLGQKAQDTASNLGHKAEVLAPDRLLARAWELAEGLAKKPTLLLRYTRLLLTEQLRRQMHDLLGYGLAMESLALFEKPEPQPR